MLVPSLVGLKDSLADFPAGCLSNVDTSCLEADLKLTLLAMQSALVDAGLDL